ncbi:MAG: tetratricopeptide repeat protein [Bacteroidetes bacterium]|nr:tetratricopeptide repeat protein [Bacteroidota bacterium]
MNTSERVVSLLKMLEKEPYDSFLNYALALEYHKQGKLQEAIQLILQLLNRDENYLGAYLQIGQLLEEAGDLKEALLWYERGCVIAKVQKSTKALSELNQAIQQLNEELIE